MKQNLFTSIQLLLAVLFFATSCQRNNDIEPNYNGMNLGNASIQANVIGRVIDNNGQFVTGATVKIGKEIVRTNAEGAFYFKNTPMTKDYAYVSVEKTGFFPGSRTFKVVQGRTEYVYIKLLPKTNRGIFSAAAGGSVTFDGATVTIPGEGVVRADGKPYIGLVKVLGQYLSPEATDLLMIMPGDLLGNDKANNRQLMKTWGMVAVELVGDTGEKLQIASGKEATIELPVAPSQSVGTPNEMPLWYFDEVTGFWKEEGTATLQNGKFVGKVKHFSFWNCDTPQAATATLSMTLVDVNGNPIPNMYVQLTSALYGTRGGITDNAGFVSGLIPAGDPLTMTVWDNALGQNCMVLTQAIGPFAVSTNMGNIVINSANLVSTTISGTVTDCAGASLTNGVISLTIGSSIQPVFVNNGTYSITYIACTSGVSGTIVATDLANMTQNLPISVTLSGGSQTINVQACGTTVAEYINNLMNGTASIITDGLAINCTDSVTTPNLIQVYASVQNGGGFVYESFTIDNSTSPATVTLFNFANNTSGTSNTYTVTPSSVVVTNWPAAMGQYLDCSFSGTYNDPILGLTNAPFSVNVHIKKDN